MVNKVILIGNVGKDPEIRYFENDQAVAKFSLATTERGFKTRDGQEIPDRTEWHNIVAWRGLAKLSEGYIKKGTRIYVEGKLRSHSYDDANGVKRYVTEIVADVINLLSGRPNAEGDASSAQGQTTATAPESSSSQSKSVIGNDGPTAPLPFENDGGTSDDLPF
jgi:single-strand DNA-binding protein